MVLRPLSRTEKILLAGILIPIMLILGAVLTETLEPQGHTITSPPHLYLTVGFNFTTGEDEYFPANFSVPVDVETIITITNYDNGTNAVPNAFGQVTGTVGGDAIINGQPVTSVPGSIVSHTFTVTSLGLNVPLPPSSSVTFTVLVETAGVYAWHCMAPCDANAMATPGFMQGELIVE